VRSLVWLERWQHMAAHPRKVHRGAEPIAVFDRLHTDAGWVDTFDRARLAAAAPLLVRDALLGEWVDEGGINTDFCPTCGGAKPTHAVGCTKNEALSAAGFLDQASRQAARERMAKPS
jgi:hypothetical protein